MKSTFWLAVIGLCTALAAHAQESPADFTTQVPLRLSGEGPWYRLSLPLDIQLKAQQTDLSDVRVFNAAGEAQPYSLTQEQTRVSASQKYSEVKGFPLYDSADANSTVQNIQVQSNSNGTLVQIEPSSQHDTTTQVRRGWLLDASAINDPLQQLTLDWSSDSDGFQQFSIEASNDLQHWQAWGEGQVARLAFAGEQIEQQEVALPGRQARYLRLQWKTPQQAPVLTSARIKSSNLGTVIQPLAWSAPLAGSSSKNGEYSWQLPKALKVEQVQVQLSQTNSLAPVTLSGRLTSNSPWQILAGGSLYRLSLNGQEVLKDQLQLSGQTVQQLRLIVDERGGLGSDAPTIRYAIHPAQLVFLARGAGPYSLALGNTKAKALDLPLSTLVPDYKPERLDSLGQAKVEDEALVTRAKPAVEPSVQTDTNWKKIGLWAVLLLGVLFLGAMAYSLLRNPPSKS